MIEKDEDSISPGGWERDSAAEPDAAFLVPPLK